MKITVAAIGRMKSGPEADLLDTYVNRARQQGRAAGITAISVADHAESRKSSSASRQAEEAGILLDAIPAGACIAVLDERGDAISSEQFAALIGRELAAGTSDLAFCIGGPDGHGNTIRSAARHTISLGRMTWPHKLARALLAEQIYRAVTILVNHPYHRD